MVGGLLLLGSTRKKLTRLIFFFFFFFSFDFLQTYYSCEAPMAKATGNGKIATGLKQVLSTLTMEIDFDRQLRETEREDLRIDKTSRKYTTISNCNNNGVPSTS